MADFFDHARANSKKLWKELDGDGDGWVTERDVARALAARGLPTAYAPRVLAAARGQGALVGDARVQEGVCELDGAGGAAGAEGVHVDEPGQEREGRREGIKDVLKRSGVVSRRVEWSGRGRRERKEREREKKLNKKTRKKLDEKLFKAATDDAAKGVLRALRSGEDGAASYAQFRSFVALLPPTTTTGGKASSSAPAAGAAARRKNNDDDDDDYDDFASGSGSGGGGGGFDPATAWFDAASIVPLVSGTPALEEAAAAAALGRKAAKGTRTTTRRQEQQPAPLHLLPLLAELPKARGRPKSPRCPAPGRARRRDRLRGHDARALPPGHPQDAPAGELGEGAGGKRRNNSGGATTTLASVVREGILDKRALYRGVVPASLGSFFSHGLRTFSYEAALMVLTAAGFGASAAAASMLSLGAAATERSSSAEREQQRSRLCRRGRGLLPAPPPGPGLRSRNRDRHLRPHPHGSVEAAPPGRAPPQRAGGREAAKEAGGLPWSLFAGTGATLAREVPFYAAGMAAYEMLKNVADGSATSPTRTPSRELARWEMIALGE